MTMEINDKDWISVYSSNDEYKPVMVRTYLNDHGIEAHVLNKKDSSYLIGDIEVMVRKEKLTEAQNVLKNLNIE